MVSTYLYFIPVVRKAQCKEFISGPILNYKKDNQYEELGSEIYAVPQGQCKRFYGSGLPLFIDCKVGMFVSLCARVCACVCIRV